MIRRKSAVSLALFGVLAFCALAAQGAAAAGHEYEATNNTTAYTCLKGGTEEFADPHCDVYNGVGPYGHEAIPVNTTTAIETTNKETGPETKSAEPAVLTGTLFGIKTKITAKTVSGSGWIENVESPKNSGNMQVVGEVTTKFTEVTVDEPTCSITEPIEFTSKFHGVKDKAETTKMGLQFEPREGNTFVTLHLSGGILCPANAEVTGTTVATGQGTEGHGSGATAVFSETDSNLKFGGNPAAFTGKFTTKMTGGNPISLTTK